MVDPVRPGAIRCWSSLQHGWAGTGLCCSNSLQLCMLSCSNLPGHARQMNEHDIKAAILAIAPWGWLPLNASVTQLWYTSTDEQYHPAQEHRQAESICNSSGVVCVDPHTPTSVAPAFFAIYSWPPLVLQATASMCCPGHLLMAPTTSALWQAVTLLCTAHSVYATSKHG